MDRDRGSGGETGWDRQIKRHIDRDKEEAVVRQGETKTQMNGGTVFYFLWFLSRFCLCIGPLRWISVALKTSFASFMDRQHMVSIPIPPYYPPVSTSLPLAVYPSLLAVPSSITLFLPSCTHPFRSILSSIHHHQILLDKHIYPTYLSTMGIPCILIKWLILKLITYSG